jgi:hypothetical protein
MSIPDPADYPSPAAPPPDEALRCEPCRNGNHDDCIYPAAPACFCPCLSAEDLEQMPGEIIHLAGPAITFQAHVRQRCSWCGYVLIDQDLTRIAVPIEDAGKPFPTWGFETFVGVVTTGGFSASRHVPDDPEDRTKVPAGSCMGLPVDLTLAVTAKEDR